MTVAGQTITDERLAEIIKGCEGVTPGPWMVRDHCVFTKEPGRCVARLDWHIRDERDDANAAHIARLDPQTVAALLTELQRRREAEAGTIADGVRKAIAVVDTYIGGEHEANGRAASEIADDLRGLVQDLAASPSSPASGARVKADDRSVVWLIERKGYEGAPIPHWYAEDATGWHGWVTDAAQAKPFATRDEADAAPAYRMIASDPNIRLTEHVFLSALGEHP